MRVGEVGSDLVSLHILGRPQGSYPENFVSLSLFLAEIKWNLSKSLSGVVERVVQRVVQRVHG